MPSRRRSEKPNRAIYLALDEGLSRVTRSFEIDVADETQRSLRVALAGKSELYRRTRDALANPHDQDGQALAAALDHALDTGVTGRLTSGDWVPKT